MLRFAYICVALAACGGDTVKHITDSCVSGGSNTLEVTTASSYACHAPFMASFTVTNASCEDLTITSAEVTGVVTGGDNCTPPPDSMYPHMKTVPAGSTEDVFDLTGGMFCCFEMDCPASFQCDESYTFTLQTSQGVLSAMGSAHLDLDGCDVICP
jgi:hypothetical protein